MDSTEENEKASSSDPLTFGVEIEFVVAYVPEGQENPDPKETRTVNFEIIEEDYVSVSWSIFCFLMSNTNFTIM